MTRLVAGLLAVFAWALAPLATAQPAPPPGDPMTVQAGSHQLHARLHAPPGLERYPIVVMVYGAGIESELGGAYTQILARAFGERGIGVLAYDKRGVGGSTGAYTGADFEGLGADAAAVMRHAQALPQATHVGFWGISQAGWIIPYALRDTRDVAFAIIVSPPGVNPHEQVAYFLRRQTLSWGLSPEEADAAEAMHRAVALYYSGRASYESAQAEVDRHRGARWFNGVVTHQYWDEMTPEGRILTPGALAQAQRERPNAFEIYMARSSFVDYAPVYRILRRLPTLIIHGAEDTLLSPQAGRAVLEQALRGERRYSHEFRVYENAGHDITTPEGRVVREYLDTMADWAAARFAE
ncbi:MAG TPA: alpha/beta hydrolase [Terricaulis sp.]|nr:alpha/beta hydrolase [Terricaulis sp.]